MVEIKKKLSFRRFFQWIPLAIGITGVCGLLYICMQQSYRMNANDPQIQVAEDIASEINLGKDPLSFVQGQQINMAKSLGIYTIIYDEHGGLIGSTGHLNGVTPSLPLSIFPYVKLYGEDRFTWEPEVGVRSAVVVRHYTGGHGGYVLVGRSLEEVENRIDMLGLQIAAGWIVTLGTTLIAALLFFK